MSLEGIDQHFANMEKALAFLKSLKPQPAAPAKVEKSLTEFEELKKLFDGKDWPRAVDPALICDENNEGDKNMRAEAILDQVLVAPIKGQKFLDFGCGQGHVAAKAAALGAELAVGHDIDGTGWERPPKADNLFFTKSFEEVKAKGPYTFVLLYDVLDHLVGLTPEKAMTLVKSVLTTNGKVAVRTHPFCSATGSHLYKTENKAYLHLVFSDEELKTLGVKPGLPTAKVFHPLATYRKYFETTGFRVLQETPVQQRSPHGSRRTGKTLRTRRCGVARRSPTSSCRCSSLTTCSKSKYLDRPGRCLLEEQIGSVGEIQHRRPFVKIGRLPGSLVRAVVKRKVEMVLLMEVPDDLPDELL